MNACLRAILKVSLAGLVAATVFAGGSFSQSMTETGRGSFTLPFEAHWGTLDLKPGAYWFSVRHEESGKSLIAVKQGQQQVGWVLTSFTSDANASQDSDAALFCSSNDGVCQVEALLMPSKPVYHFNVPAGSEQLQAQISKPESVPVLVAEK